MHGFTIALVILASLAPLVNSQTPSDVTLLSYQAFNKVAEVYRSGGEAPSLVAKLNQALGMLQDARHRRSQGDNAAATTLEEQARTMLNDILNQVPTEQQKAEQASATRRMLVIALIPLAVALSTIMFYVTLRAWRWYERTKLYEMRIVEKKKTED